MPGDSDSAGQGDVGYDGGSGYGDVGYDGSFDSNFGVGYSLDPGFTGFADDPGFDPAGGFGFDPSSVDGSTIGDYSNEGLNYMDPERARQVRNQEQIDNRSWGTKTLDSIMGVLNSVPGKVGTMAIGMVNPGLALAINTTKSAYGISQGQYGPAMGQVGGRMAGEAFGPVGGLVGGMVGNQIGGQMSSGQGVGGLGSGAMGNSSTSGGAMDTLLPGLLALYQGYTNNKDINGQIGGLQSLYGQDSPYSQTLRQQLERRDAAGGRRSQYGPREVELQAALAGLNSRNAPMLQQLYNQRMLNRQRMIQAGMFGLQQAGGINGLRGLFGGGGGAPSLDFSGVYNTPSPGEFNLNEFGPGLSNTEVPDLSFLGG